MGILQYLVIGLAAALAVGFFSPRWLCLGLGFFFLFLGVGVPAIAWTIAAHSRGDTSGYGMLGTLCVIMFAAPGVFLTVLGLFKSA